MYSKARIAGHPIHPMLVAFPIAFYTATVATLLAYVGTHESFWFRVAMVANLAGIVMAVVAVIPGAIDLFALPRGSRVGDCGRMTREYGRWPYSHSRRSRSTARRSASRTATTPLAGDSTRGSRRRRSAATSG